MGWADSYNLIMVHRSRRVPDDLSLNVLAAARERLGDIPYDLTLSNPTACGLPYPANLLAPLADPRGLAYEPDPRGPAAARRTVADAYRRWGATPDPDRIVLTASTSEAYSLLFKLLCDPGDAVLVPAPSYPLFDHLARLDGVEALAYALDAEATWRIDFSALENATSRARAVVVVHPNNPTGSFVHPDDRRRLIALCREHGWALLADEVFLPFPLDGGPGEETSFTDVDDCLCCALGGLSKSLGLPQLKLAWITVGGPTDLVESALDGLDYVADAYLSVSTPVALAAAQLAVGAAPLGGAIAERCRANLTALRAVIANHREMTVPPVGGGWSAVLRVPAVVDDEALCLDLLKRCGVAVHPGRFFGFASGCWLVVSLLPEPEVFADGVRRLLAVVADTITSR